MSTQRLSKARRVAGSLRVPGDKSIGHRAMIFGALADGPGEIRGMPASHDLASTARCLRNLGVVIEGEPGDPQLIVHGRGIHGLRTPSFVLDAGNSGTTARMLLGVLAAQNFQAIIDGDDSLRRRPMLRVLNPLREMGASFEPLLEAGHLPTRVLGGQLQYCDLQPEVASAQIKGALLLAGLCGGCGCSLSEPLATRDHSEIMLSEMGARLSMGGGRLTVNPTEKLNPLSIELPGDSSAAAYFVAAALLRPHSEIRLPGVLINPYRSGLFTLLIEMGARIEFEDEDLSGGEMVATIIARSSRLSSFSVGADRVPGMIDELPLLAVLATQADGISELRGASELRVKESDRIAAIAEGLRALGGEIEELPDGFIIEGPQRLSGGLVQSFGDHRIAMSMAVAALCSSGESSIAGSGAVAVSYPAFFEDLRSVVQE